MVIDRELVVSEFGPHKLNVAPVNVAPFRSALPSARKAIQFNVEELARSV